jgi:1,2-diacylglycerol 3-alpha-glucosyltransferase
MRILLAGNSCYSALNGQSIFTKNLAEGLVKLSHEVLVITPSDFRRPYQKELNLVQIRALASLSLKRLHPDTTITLFPAKEVGRIFDTFQPQIVHIQDHYPLSRSVLYIARRRGIKTIGSNHFMPENLAPYVPGFLKIKPVFQWILWHWMLDVYNRVDITTAQSRAAAILVRSQGLRTPVFPISCGIDLARFHPDSAIDREAYRLRYGLNPDRKVFLFVGRIDNEKRLDVLLHALERINRDDIQLAIAGHGAALSKLQELSKALNLGDRVHFTGFIPADDLSALLNSVDVFIMPSEAELLSIASLEAMACGRPVLLADAVALPELATNDNNGYLFKPGDPIDLAKRIEQLADQPDRWSAMGLASLEKAKMHDLDKVVRQYEMLYETLLLRTSLTQHSNQLTAKARLAYPHLPEF